MKHLLEKTSSYAEFNKALREYRNTPRVEGLSPSQWLFGRRQRTDTPALPQAYRRLSDEEVEYHEKRRREEVEDAAKKHSPRSLPPLSVGQLVLIQHPITNRWNSRGTIVEIRSRGRSYYVDIDGKQYLRNRRFLRPCLNQDLPHYEEEEQVVESILNNSTPEAEVETDAEAEVEREAEPEAPPVRKSKRQPKKNVRYIETCKVKIYNV